MQYEKGGEEKKCWISSIAWKGLLNRFKWCE